MTHPARRKFLGQHFLQNPSVLRSIVVAAKLEPGDTVLEIGPGTGTLTVELLSHVKKLIAVEKDPELCTLLKNKFAGRKNFTLICTDILQFNPNLYFLFSDHYVIVANIPYGITGRIFRLMFGTWPRPSRAVLMVQKEVALRVTAMPPKSNRLAAIVQYFSNPRIIRIVPRSAFSPEPEVDSAILELAAIRRPRPHDAPVADLISLGFSHPRKLLASNLAAKFGRDAVLRALDRMYIPRTIRPAALAPGDWEHLSTFLA